MNKTCLMFGFVLSEGAGKARGKTDEVGLLLDCLHLIKKIKQEN